MNKPAQPRHRNKSSANPPSAVWRLHGQLPMRGHSAGRVTLRLGRSAALQLQISFHSERKMYKKCVCVFLQRSHIYMAKLIHVILNVYLHDFHIHISKFTMIWIWTRFRLTLLSTLWKKYSSLKSKSNRTLSSSGREELHRGIILSKKSLVKVQARNSFVKE